MACAGYGCPVQSTLEELPFGRYRLKLLAALLVASSNLPLGWLAPGHGYNFLASNPGSQEATRRLIGPMRKPITSIRLADASAGGFDARAAEFISEGGQQTDKQKLMGCMDSLEALKAGASQQPSLISKRDYVSRAALAAALLCTPGVAKAADTPAVAKAADTPGVAKAAETRDVAVTEEQANILNALPESQRQTIFSAACTEGIEREMDDSMMLANQCLSMPYRAKLEKKGEAPILIRQDKDVSIGADRTGGLLWNAEIALAKFLEKEGPYVNKTIVELSCGTGLAGIAAAQLGPKSVILADAAPKALTLAKENAKKNLDDEDFARISTLSYKWGAPLPKKIKDADLIIASEITYDVNTWNDIEKTFSQLSSDMILAVQYRRKGEEQAFITLMTQAGYNTRIRKVDAYYDFADTGVADNIRFYKCETDRGKK